jgi:hypothetical protein
MDIENAANEQWRKAERVSQMRNGKLVATNNVKTACK